MNCEEASLLIDEFHDGELNHVLKKRLENHNAHCQSCQTYFESAQAVNQLLDKSSVPPPSNTLDQKIMQALNKRQKNTEVSSSWWRRLFAGSISIPKPVLAVVLVVVAIAITAANIIGRNYSNASNAEQISTASTQNNPSSPTESAAQTKIVEVPVIKVVEVPVIKKSVVERVVYVNRYLKSDTSEMNKLQNDLITGDSDKGKIYFAQTSLKGFEPLSEIETKIIKAGELDEK